jgi:hypothetical protein
MSDRTEQRELEWIVQNTDDLVVTVETLATVRGRMDSAHSDGAQSGGGDGHGSSGGDGLNISES